MPKHTYLTDGKESCFEIRVGWDEVLETFVVRIWNVTGEDLLTFESSEAEAVFRAGTCRGEIETVDELAKLLRPYGEVPEDLLDMLRDDRHFSIAFRPRG